MSKKNKVAVENVEVTDQVVEEGMETVVVAGPVELPVKVKVSKNVPNVYGITNKKGEVITQAYIMRFLQSYCRVESYPYNREVNMGFLGSAEFLEQFAAKIDENGVVVKPAETIGKVCQAAMRYDGWNDPEGMIVAPAKPNKRAELMAIREAAKAEKRAARELKIAEREAAKLAKLEAKRAEKEAALAKAQAESTEVLEVPESPIIVEDFIDDGPSMLDLPADAPSQD